MWIKSLFSLFISLMLFASCSKTELRVNNTEEEPDSNNLLISEYFELTDFGMEAEEIILTYSGIEATKYPESTACNPNTRINPDSSYIKINVLGGIIQSGEITFTKSEDGSGVPCFEELSFDKNSFGLKDITGRYEHNSSNKRLLLKIADDGGGDGGGGGGGGEIQQTVAPHLNIGGLYYSPLLVTMMAEEGASIYYTTNGDTPSASSTPYAEPISVSSDTTIKAIAIKDGQLDSNIITKKYRFSTHNWISVGPEGLAGNAGNAPPKIAIENTDIYIADTPGGWTVKILKFNLGSWDEVGSFAGNSPNIQIHDGVLYLIYYSGATDTRIMKKYAAGIWTDISLPEGIKISTTFRVFNEDAIYIYYQDEERNLSVMKYNGSTWSHVGNPGFAKGDITWFSSFIEVSGGVPYVAYSDYNASYKVSVKKFNGTSWVYVGDPGFAGLEDVGTGYRAFPVLALADENTPYVFFQDVFWDNGPLSSKGSVMKFNGSEWVYVGEPGFTYTSVDYYSKMLIDNTGIPYIAMALCTKARDLYGCDPQLNVVRYYNDDWETVGNPGSIASGKQIDEMSFVIANGEPYVGTHYLDNEDTWQIEIMKFTETGPQ